MADVGDASFPRSARLLIPEAYSAVFEKRNARRGRFFHLHLGTLANVNTGDVPEAQNLPQARLGIAVPKKLLKTAVHRNVVKRIARETFRKVRGSLEHRDFVLRLAVKLNPQQQAIDRKALAEDIGSLFARNGNPGQTAARSISPNPPGQPLGPLS